jgi:hypothetical protein
MGGISYNVWLRDLYAGLSWFCLLYFPAECISSNSEGSTKLPDDGRLLPKHVGACILNKGMAQSVDIFGHFYYIQYAW